jgi:hypothetical protein
MAQFRAILKTLVEHEVEFILVGGLAAVLQGAPVTTHDVDIVYSRGPHNLARLLRALRSMDAVFRADRRRLRPNESHLASAGHKLLETAFGDLDCLGTIEESTTYDDLLPFVDTMVLEELTMSVISLPRLIEVKEKLTRPKDQLMLLQLRATLEEREKNSTGRSS